MLSSGGGVGIVSFTFSSSEVQDDGGFELPLGGLLEVGVAVPGTLVV